MTGKRLNGLSLHLILSLHLKECQFIYWKSSTKTGLQLTQRPARKSDKNTDITFNERVLQEHHPLRRSKTQTVI